jgi:hypothetical protein
VSGGLRARDPEQRADQVPLARRHAEQRPAPGGSREPVEDRLDLVGGGVAGGEVGPARRGQLPAGRVPGLARPGLHVAGRLPRPAQLEGSAEPLAQCGAERRVVRGRVAQPVLAMQRGDVRGAGDPDREVEQADGVAPAGEEHDDRAPGREQAAGPHGVDEVRARDSAGPPGRIGPVAPHHSGPRGTIGPVAPHRSGPRATIGPVAPIIPARARRRARSAGRSP